MNITEDGVQKGSCLERKMVFRKEDGVKKGSGVKKERSIERHKVYKKA